MIKTLILYYLSLKPTHGYEIQKFIQVNHMDSWTKIQSGSIYYALAKLEKEGLIKLHQEENVGGKLRKVYEITTQGRNALVEGIKNELNRDLYDIGSDKFIIYPILYGIGKEEIIRQIKKHIEKLKRQKVEQEKWQKRKIDKNSLKVEAICFEMMISSLTYQIKWHEALLEELDKCKIYSEKVAELIQTVDFSTIDELPNLKSITTDDEVERLKQEILSNPTEAASKLEQLIALLNQ